MQNTGTSFNTTNLATGCVGTVAVASGDVSGDLNPDLAMVCENSKPDVHRADRQACRAPTPSATRSARPWTVSPPDYRAREQSTATPSRTPPSFSGSSTPRRRLADGQGRCVRRTGVLPGRPRPTGVARGDLDGDGLVDLICGNTGADSISVIRSERTAERRPSTSPSVCRHQPGARRLQPGRPARRGGQQHRRQQRHAPPGRGTGHFTFAGNYGTRDPAGRPRRGGLQPRRQPDLAVADSFSDT